jgi:lipopolysaccharide/colanic/teichoic acid biosynthesis glycosyltransferase
MDSTNFRSAKRNAEGRVDAESVNKISATGSDPDQKSSGSATVESVRIPIWKRALDITCLLLTLPTVLPVMLLIALIIKVGSAGPVMFKQERVGFLGQRFTLFKFRTMIPGACTVVHEQYVANLIDNDRPMTKLDAHGDVRLIPLGRLLRAAGLDELPQLINVLLGDMSLVGPRPCVPREYEKYLPCQMERFQTLPGLTGLWQVSGKNRTTFNQMIDLDIQYVRSKSLGLDLKIMLKTIPAVIVEVEDLQEGTIPTQNSPMTSPTAIKSRTGQAS